MSDISKADRGYELTDRGLLITRSLSFAEWKSMGLSLSRIGSRTQWAIGDWLAYGSSASKFRDYGEFYDHVVEITGRTYTSIEKFVRVSMSYPHETRNFNLSWSHYREALRLSDDDRQIALRSAEMNKWSLEYLTTFINTRGGPVELLQSDDADVDNEQPSPKRMRHAQLRQHKSEGVCPKCGYVL